MRGDGPLRYPGAKSNLVGVISRFLERHNLVGMPMVEPFAGSAAVSRYLLFKNLIPSAKLYELDRGAYAFWKVALSSGPDLKELIRKASVNLDEFDRNSDIVLNANALSDEVELAFAFLFLNRTSYSGIVGAGPIGGRSQTSAYSIDCRFNRERLCSQIDAISRLSGRLSIEYGDGIAAIEASSADEILYVDPPYFTNGKKFYRKYFNTFEHYRLRRALMLAHGRWLLSYDYDKKVEYLYRTFPMTAVNLYHCARTAGAKSELLVSPLGFSNVVEATEGAAGVIIG